VSNTKDKIIFKITGKAVTIIDRNLKLGNSVIPAVRLEGRSRRGQSTLSCMSYLQTRGFADNLRYIEIFQAELFYGQ